ALEKQTRAIARLEEQIGQDREIIVLRERITAEAASRLSEGVLTATQYITEVNAESQARQAQALHLLQLVHAKLDYLTTLGVEP
ncbi:MAG: transporter, partial [Bacteroidetes bacterium]|nr:transporter [Bacteroidota bacterium]